MTNETRDEILELVITAIRDGAEFLELDYYEGAAEVNTSPSTWKRMIHELRAAGLLVGGVSGYYPPEAIEIVKEIVALRARGYSLREIKKQLDEDRKAKVKR